MVSLAIAEEAVISIVIKLPLILVIVAFVGTAPPTENIVWPTLNKFGSPEETLKSAIS